jgi:tRNA nucleotidyltransferase/poly(A) polymerase
MAAMRESANEIDSLARERVVEELNKMLLCDVPGDAIYLLDKVGILKRILPELAATKGVETVDKHGHEDTFPHTLSVLDNIAKLETSRSSETTNSLGIKQGEPNLWLRWTALLHDIGKPVSKRFVDGKGWTFYGYDVAGARMIPKVFSSLKLPLNEKLKYVQKLISLQNRPKMLIDTDSSESAFRRLLFDSSGDIEDLILLCEANITTRNKTKANQEFADMESVRQRLLEVQAKDAIRNFKNPISANYIMELYGLEPCNLLGTLKDYIKDAILSGEIGNNFEEADVLLRKKAAEMGLLTKEEKEKAEFNHSIVGTPSVERPSGSVRDVIPPLKNEVVADDVRADAGENSELTFEQSTSPIDEPQNETQPSDVLDRDTLISQILHAMNDCGVVKLYFMATGEDLDEIQAKRSISKESIFLFTHDTSKDIQGKLVWALEVKLDALALPEAMVIWNGMPSKDLTIGTRIADLRILKDNSWDSTPPKESENLFSDYAFVIPKSLPVDYIINFESVYDEYSTILVF